MGIDARFSIDAGTVVPLVQCQSPTVVVVLSGKLGSSHPALLKALEVKHIAILDIACIGHSCRIGVAIGSIGSEDTTQFHHHFVHVGKLHFAADVQLQVVVEVIAQVEGNLVILNDVGTTHGTAHPLAVAHVYVVDILIVGQQLVMS